MADLKLYGAPWCPDCKQSKQFLAEQRIEYDWFDIDKDEEARTYVQKVNDGKQIIPTIVFPDGSLLVEPSNAELADKLGIPRQAQMSYYDVIIVGGGPSGLTSAIYTAREGLSTLIVERAGIGGQAGITREIENYPGFPEPIGGDELADRLQIQAKRFGVEILAAQQVTSIIEDHDHIEVAVETGETYCTGAVILATGSTYARLGVPGEDDLVGAGIHFCATCDGPFYKGKDMVVVGGGNSAYQEAIFLTKFAKSVTLLVASAEPRASKALQDKVAERSDVSVLTQTTIEEFRGENRISSILVKDAATDTTSEMNPAAVFIFIGMRPNTEFLEGIVDLDERGFIKTRENLETSIGGVFAAGDARVGSTKQVAAAIGEGATAAIMVREHLERLGETARHIEEAPEAIAS